jgi:hypothetical protein
MSLRKAFVLQANERPWPGWRFARSRLDSDGCEGRGGVPDFPLRRADRRSSHIGTFYNLPAVLQPFRGLTQSYRQASTSAFRHPPDTLGA